MASGLHKPAGRSVCLLIGFVCIASAARGQSLPCEDLDGDTFTAGPGCAVQQDCNDQNRAVHPGAAEICNGWDDDCDGERDEGCDRTCDDFQLARRVMFKSGGFDVRIANADRSWALAFRDNFVPNDGLTVSRLDRRGARLVDDRVFGDTSQDDAELVWTGSEVIDAWDHIGSFGLYMQPLGAWAHGTADPTQLVPSNHARINTFLWNGYELAILWYGCGFTGDLMCLSRIAADGRVWEDRLSLSTVMHWDGSISWNGDGYGWAYSKLIDSGNTEVFFERLDRDGSPVVPEIQVTDHSGLTGAWGSGEKIASKGPARGYGVCWIDNRTGIESIRCMILDDAGNPVVPPGEIQVSNTVKDVGQLSDMAWNGEEFLVVWTNLDTSHTGMGKIEAARVSALGQVLERKFVTDGPQDNDMRLAWSGSSWGMSFEEWPTYPAGFPGAVFAEIGCNCATDADGDGVLPCAGGDCDDADPAVAAGKKEVCTDSKDNDCDGLVDCNDSDCNQNGSAPGETVGLTFGASKDAFEWTANGAATAYDVARGTLSDLREMKNFKWTDCLRSRYTATSTSDPEVPPAGSGFYYLVRGRARTCLLGTWGHTGRDGVLAGCP